MTIASTLTYLVSPTGRMAREREDAMRIKKKNISAAAALLGHLGGLRGGPARARKLNRKQRSASARKAVQARWRKYRAARRREKT